MGTHPIFESDFDCLTECTMNIGYSLKIASIGILSISLVIYQSWGGISASTLDFDQSRLKFETMLTPVWAQSRLLTMHAIIGLVASALVPSGFFIAMFHRAPVATKLFALSLLCSHFSFLSLFITLPNQFVCLMCGFILAAAYLTTTTQSKSSLTDLAYVFVNLEVCSIISPWLTRAELCLVPLLPLLQLYLQPEIKTVQRAGIRRFLHPGAIS